MPIALRDRLVAAASRSERSINSEIVARLEASLDADDLEPSAPAHMRAQPRSRGISMTRRKRHALAACGVTLALAVAAVAGLTLSGTSTPAAAPSGEMPTALGAHLAELSKAIPGNGGESADGPGSAEEQEFAALAYPDTDVSLAKLQGMRAAGAALKGKFSKGKGSNGSWVSVGPSNALYPATQFRNSFSYVPAEYSAGGRTTSLAIAPTCKPGNCRLWLGVAGGGVWRTKNALAGSPSWEFLSGSFGIQAIGSIVVDPNDPSGNTIYAGTGEANSSGDSAAGVGLYKSTNGGDTWTGPLGAAVFNARAIGAIAIKPGSPNTLYAGITRAVRGVASVSSSGVSVIPGAAKWGLYKSTDGGATWSFVHNGAATTAPCTGDATESANGTPCSPRGVRQVELDPTNPEIVYASSYARGIWRSPDGGATWTQIKASLLPTATTTRAAIDVTKLPNGNTRMYVYEGNTGAPFSRLFRSDDVATGAPVFNDLTSSSTANTGFATFNLCGPQCWYDVFVYTPAGHPDVVYSGGSYAYGEVVANKRAVVLSTDAGVSGTDMTFDGTDPLHPNGLHPDQHALVTNPDNPMQFFEANDGGVMRSSGDFVDRSSWCTGAPNRGLSGSALLRCEQMLSKIPSKLEGIIKGLPTLQFQSLSVSPHNKNILQGGTQDNGTWETPGNPVKWENTMIGDGGQSGFDAVMPEFRFHTFFDASPDVNFSNGDIADWNWIADPIYNTGGLFYVPIITDPQVSRTMFVGTTNVLRTKTHGMGTMTLAEFRQHCNEWTGDFAVTCGDWVPIASPSVNSAARGDRAGGAVTAVERTTADTSTAWASTQLGRVLISKNADADPAGSVTWTRLDDLAANDPNRYVSGIYVDPANPNHAWVSYTGFNATTPTLPGHVFEVTYNPVAGTATWVDRSYDLGDLPINDIVLDPVTGDVYASSDFGVHMLAAGATSWTSAAPGMPNVEVAGLTIDVQNRALYAATHGLSAWKLNLG
jgi:hypothetical protein